MNTMTMNHTMQNQSWLNTTVVRSTSVVPATGFGMGDVRLRAVDVCAAKRHAAFATAIPASGFQPWSPPVP